MYIYAKVEKKSKKIVEHGEPRENYNAAAADAKRGADLDLQSNRAEYYGHDYTVVDETGEIAEVPVPSPRMGRTPPPPPAPARKPVQPPAQASRQQAQPEQPSQSVIKTNETKPIDPFGTTEQ